MKNFDVLIIGGGPAGLISAIRSASLGKKVLIAEKNSELAQKLLLAGRGRCNFTNAEEDINIFISKYGENGKFLYHAFNEFSPADTVKFFEDEGVKTVIERGKRIYPAEGGGQKILNVLMKLCKKYDVWIFRRTPVLSLKIQNSKVQCAITSDEEIKAEKYIIATGGLSYPETGSTGDGYKFAQVAGHEIIKTYPALVPVRTAETFVKLAKGCNLRNVRISVILDDKKINERFGEMEFTNFGLSGPIIMELSSYIPDWKGDLKFSLDLKPSLTPEILTARIHREIEKFSGKRKFSGLVRRLVPDKLVPLILELSDVPHDKPVEYISEEEISEFVTLLKNIIFHINGLWNYKNAIITRGGINLKEVDPMTMRSKICENLYFAGEALDLNGPSGGFNLQMCWSTGYVAGSI